MDERNTAKEDNVLRLNKGDAYKIKIEGSGDMEISPFREVYEIAIRTFGEIHRDNLIKYANPNEFLRRAFDRLPEFNTAIGFCGERGSGKTSAMVSFRNFLHDWNRQPNGNKENGLFETLNKEAPNTKFVCLDTVDPSRFEPHDRLIGSILGELYRRFETAINEKSNKLNHDQQRKVEDAFKHALTAVQLLSNSEAQPFGTPGAGENTFDILKRAGKAASARELMHTLVTELLTFLSGEEKGQRSYLVIPVDDIDMSVQHAYILAEDIRKYFMIPNVVILLAAKVDQLRMAVEQSYVGRFEHYMKRLKKPDQEEIESMSNLYLEKLMPLGRRIPMPGLSAMTSNQNLKFSWEGEAKNDLQSLVLDMVFRKTLLRLIPLKGQIHPIVPATLRELHNFLAFLSELEDITKKSTSNQIIASIAAFKRYFLDEWIPRNLIRGDEALIFDIDRAPLEGKLAAIYQAVSKKNPEKMSLLFAKFRHLDLRENIRLVTLGDVRLILDELVDKNRSLYENFSFSIKTLLSFELIRTISAIENDESEFCTITNGSLSNPAKAILRPRAMCDTTKFKKFGLCDFSSGRLLLEKRLQFEESGQEKLAEEQRIPNFMIDFCKNSDANGELLRFISAFTYLGKFESNVDQEEYEDSPWFDYLESIGKQGSGTNSISFDFEAIFFWLLVPKTNLARFDQVFDPGTNAQKIDWKNWAIFLQMEVYEHFRRNLRKNYIQRRKSRDFMNPEVRLKVSFQFFQKYLRLYFDEPENPHGIQIPQELNAFSDNALSEGAENWFGILDQAIIRALIFLGTQKKSEDTQNLEVLLSSFQDNEIVEQGPYPFNTRVKEFGEILGRESDVEYKERFEHAKKHFDHAKKRTKIERQDLALVIVSIIEDMLARREADPQ